MWGEEYNILRIRARADSTLRRGKIYLAQCTDFCYLVSSIIYIFHALVAQLDRATDYESVGREFESLQARQIKTATYIVL